MTSPASVDVRLLRGSKPLRNAADILDWLDLHDRVTNAPGGRLFLFQRELAIEWRRPESTVRRFLSALSEAGWIRLSSSRRGASIELAAPPAFVRSAELVLGAEPAQPVAEAVLAVVAVEPAVSALPEPVEVASPPETVDEIEARETFAEGKPHTPLPSPPRAGSKDKKQRKAPASKQPSLPLFEQSSQEPASLEPRSVPVEVAEADDFALLRASFVQWCHEIYTLPAGKVLTRWNVWASKYARDHVSMMATELMGMPEDSWPDEPLSYLGAMIKNQSEGNTRTPSPKRHIQTPMRPAVGKLVTKAEEMGHTDGLIATMARNAKASELSIAFQ